MLYAASATIPMTAAMSSRRRRFIAASLLPPDTTLRRHPPMPPAELRCPSCSHILLTIDLPQARAVAPPAGRQPDEPLLLRISEAARLLTVSRSTMYQLVARGEVPAVRIGRSVRVSRRELERMVG